MFKLDFKAEEADIKLPTFVGSLRKKGNTRKTSTWASLTKALERVDHNKLEIFKEIGIPYLLTCLQKKAVCGSRSNN